MPRLPLVALIDVVLFILLYFMLSSNMSQDESHLASTLRADSKSGRGSAMLPQVLEVSGGIGGAEYRLGERVMQDKAGLTQILGKLPKDGGVFVRVRGNAQVASVATAMQACRDAGFTKISYVPAN